MTRTTRILTEEDVARAVDIRATLRIVRGAFMAMAKGEAVMPPKLYLPLPHRSDFRAMPAWLKRPAACGVKWVNVHPRNPTVGLPSVMAVIVINDPATGFPLAVMDGMLVTKLRTAAAGAVAAKALARSASRRVGLVGCGAQADAQLMALAEMFTLSRIQVWGYHRQEAARFCRRMRRLLPRCAFVPCPTVQTCVRGVDIVVTLTPSRRPLVKRSWLSPGVHINAIGADAPGKQELDAQILRDATVVVDHREQAIHAGELNVPVRRRQFDPRRIHATLGEVLIGRRCARQTRQELTVFDSTGLAIHDVALGYAVVQQARRRHLGRSLRLFTPSRTP